MAYRMLVDRDRSTLGPYIAGDPPEDLVSANPCLVRNVLGGDWRPRDLWCDKLRTADACVEAKLANGGLHPDKTREPHLEAIHRATSWKGAYSNAVDGGAK